MMTLFEMIDTGSIKQPISFFNYSMRPKSWLPNFKPIEGYYLWTCCIDEPNHAYYSLVFYPEKHKEGSKIEVIYWDSCTGFRVIDWVHGKFGLYSHIVNNVMLLNRFIEMDFWNWNEVEFDFWIAIMEDVTQIEQTFLNYPILTKSMIKKVSKLYMFQ